MAIPELKLSMLGTTGSGKTTFLLGMYDIMSTGLHGYFVFTEDPDQGADLRDSWDDLFEKGRLPPNNGVDVSTSYRFVFNHGFTPLITVDWLDYRGGAVGGRSGDGEDVARLRARLAESDSIYLVLDGGKIASWLNGEVGLTQVQRSLKVNDLSTEVQQAVAQRRANGMPIPSLAVLITKADLLAGPGRRLGDALATVVKNLDTMLPVVWSPGVTTFICPVKVGNFGTDTSGTGTVDAGAIDPVGLHRPMIFSLAHYLTEGLGAREAGMTSNAVRNSSVQGQLADLNQGFMSFFRGRKIAELRSLSDSYEKEIEKSQDAQRADQNLILMLGREIQGHPIIRDGKLEM
jgi:hypothetical protein